MTSSVFHHVGLTVTDLDRSCKWFEEALDFQVERIIEFPPIRAAFLINDADERLELFERPGSVDVARFRPDAETWPLGFGHVAFRVDDVEESYARLIAAGATESLKPHQSPLPEFRIAYAIDPDGNAIELVQVIELAAA